MTGLRPARPRRATARSRTGGARHPAIRPDDALADRIGPGDLEIEFESEFDIVPERRDFRVD